MAEAVARRLGAFVLDERIGQGAMGAVFRARHEGSGLEVAVKVVHPEVGRLGSVRDAFRREVRHMARLNHPNIAAVLDQGVVPPETPGLQAGSPWMAMELARGGTLAGGGTWSWTDIRAVLVSVLDALAYAHARQVIHRDLKPSNVLLDGWRSRVAVADFGLAIRLDEDAGPELLARAGTPNYMAPEQVFGVWRDLGPWTDLFALGCLTWTMVCGRSPFAGQQHHRRRLPSFSPRLDVPPELARWVATLLQPAPARRFPSAAVAREALPQGPSRAVSVQVFVDDATTVADADTAPSWPEPLPRGRRVHPVPPADWRQDGVASAPLAHGAGLGLYGVRTLPLVGRDAQRDALWRMLRDVAGVGAGRAVVLAGGTGVGKSRLARWLCERAAEVDAATTLQVFHSDRPGAEDGLVAALERVLRSEGLERVAVAERVRAWAPDLSPETVARVVELVRPRGRDEPHGDLEVVRLPTRDARRAVWRHILAEMAPVVLWVDDAQWGPEAVALVRSLPRDLPVLAVLTWRTDLAPPPADLAVLDTPPLEGGQRRTLVRTLLELPEVLAHQVEARTEGNPLFAVHLVGDWVQRGLLEAHAEGYRLRPGADVRIPDSLHALWGVRLRQVLASDAEADWSALELAAVLGPRASLEEWRALCAECEVSTRPGLIDDLAAAGLVEVTDRVLVFAHGMLVESILRLASESGRLGRHRERAGAWLVERGRELASKGWTEAGLGLLRRAVPLVDRHGLLDARLQYALGHSLHLHGEMDASHTHLERASALAATHGDVALQARVCLSLAYSPRTRQQSDRVRTLLDQALTLFVEVGDVGGQGTARLNLGQLELWDGRLDAAETALEGALALYRQVGDTRGTGSALQLLANVYGMRGRPDRSGPRYAEALRAFREVGSRRDEAWTLANLSAHHDRLGSPSEAQRYAEEALEASRAIGYRAGEGMALTNLGNVRMVQEDPDGARACYRRAADIHRELGNTRSEAVALVNLAIAVRDTGDLAQARAVFAEARRRQEQIGGARLAAHILGGLSEVERQAGDTDAAARALEEAVVHAEEAGDVALLASLRDRLANVRGAREE